MPAVNAIKWIIVALFLFIMTIQDIRKKELSLKVMVLFFLAGLALRIFFDGSGFIDALYGMLIGAAMIVLSKLSRGAAGLGDGIVLVVTGLYMGFDVNLEIFIWGLSLCAIVGLFLLLVMKADRKKRIPFVPFLSAGYLLTALVEYMSLCTY